MSSDYVVDYQDILGYGNYGTVYGAINKSTEDRNLAVKVFKSSDASAEEIEIMQYLANHKLDHIANIVEVLEVNGRKAIVMERLSGGEVFERILSDGQFSEHRAARCLVALVKALIDLKSIANVLHRDVKPENLVFVNQSIDSDVKLIDFGLAIKVTPFNIAQGTRLGKRPVGTASYMSPETIRICEYSAKTEVWSAGVTLYALLSGTAPFDQDNKIRQRQQILTGSFMPFDSTPTWAHVSPEAKDLVVKMLTVNPVDRISLEEILEHPWVNKALSSPPMNFGEGYFEEIRSLSAKSNFKKIVNATVLTIRLRRNAITSLLKGPTKEMTAPASSAPESSTENPKPSDSVLPTSDAPNSVTRTSTEAAVNGFSKEQIAEMKERFAKAAEQSAARRTDIGASSPSAINRDIGIDFQAFKEVMFAVGLEHMATSRVFQIFDTDGNGLVDYREFMSTLATFRASDEEAIRLYFDMFDIDNSGEISFEELKLVMAAMLHTDDEEEAVEHSEHDRSSPVPLSEPTTEPTANRSVAETMLDEAVNQEKTVFEFVPVSESTHTTTTHKEITSPIEPAPSPLSLQNMRPSSQTSSQVFEPFSKSEGGSFTRIASLVVPDTANPLQSVFQFVPKVKGMSIEELFREMDVNKDGKISFEEYKEWMTKDLQRLKDVVRDALY